MKLYAAMLAFFAFSAGPVAAGTIENAFGNTITVTSPEGQVARYHFEPDGRFAAIFPDGKRIQGAWAMREGQVCLNAPEIPEDCNPLAADKDVGDEWSMTIETGASYTLSIVPGR